MDIQPLVRSVLDGYNVCIFAYGQTGSGKTYTMVIIVYIFIYLAISNYVFHILFHPHNMMKVLFQTGPHSATEKEWGVNYRALNDLFHISWNRRDAYVYEVCVQMVEIYNEQVRDLLAGDGTQKKYPFLHSFFHSIIVLS